MILKNFKQNMMHEECPNCRQITNTSCSRLIKDSCGHTKCRMCLLYEEQGCKACHDEHRIQNLDNFGCITSINLMPENISIDAQNSIINDETILPLELVINKDTRSENLNSISINEKADEKFQTKENVGTKHQEPDMCKLAIVDTTNNNALNRLYIPKKEPCDVITNICAQLTESTTPTSQSQTSSTLPVVAEDSKSSATKSEITEKEKLLKSKQLRHPDRSHISVIPGELEKYKCNVCNKVFRNKKGKCYHDACITGIKPYHCKICDRSFVKRSHYEYHERVHSGYKPYKCTLCDKAFPQQNKLNRHMYSHSKEKQFICSKCDKRYSKQDDLKNHLSIHNSTKSHTCKICKKSFHILATLNRHMRTHTNERPHVCDQCNKSFKDKSLLVRHKRTHGKDRPFSCAHCNRVFLSKSELIRHITVHSDEKPFSCKYCQTVFRRKDNLNRHIRHHHSEDSNCEVSKRQISPPERVKKTSRQQLNNDKKQKQKPKRAIKNTVNSLPRSPKKVSVVYVTSHEQINSRLDSMGNITPVIRNTSELSNAVPVINGPISIKKIDEKTDVPKKTFTYTEPIPPEEAVVINRRIEEKLYPQNNYFFRNSSSHINKLHNTSITQPIRTSFNVKDNSSSKSISNDISSTEQNTSQTTLLPQNIKSTAQETEKLDISKYQDCPEGTSVHNKGNVVIDAVNNSMELYTNKEDVDSKKNTSTTCENLSATMSKEAKTNCVSTIMKHTLYQPELNNLETHKSIHKISHPTTDSTLPTCTENINEKNQNIHWRRRTAEIFKECGQ